MRDWEYDFALGIVSDRVRKALTDWYISRWLRTFPQLLIKANVCGSRHPRILRDLAIVNAGLRYGNTQALIIGAFGSGGNTEYKIVVPRDIPLDPIGAQARDRAIASILEINDYEHNNRATCLPAHVALAEYAGFKTLFGERKFAERYPPEASTVNFMALPGELRNRIYRFILIVEPEIDLVPKRQYLGGRRMVKLKPILRLLRVNRSINQEASAIYYGENEFRCSCSWGWVFLLAFLRRIGLANASRLRKVAVALPGVGFDQNQYLQLEDTSDQPYTPDQITTILYSLGLQDDKTKPPTLQACVQGSLKILERAGNLTHLRLVLPASFNFTAPLRSLRIKSDKFKKLEVSLAHLYKVNYGVSESQDSSQSPLEVFSYPNGKEVVHTHRDVKAWADSQGLSYVKVWYDDTGSGLYPVHNSKTCATSHDDGKRGLLSECECEVAMSVSKWYGKK